MGRFCKASQDPMDDDGVGATEGAGAGVGSGVGEGSSGVDGGTGSEAFCEAANSLSALHSFFAEAEKSAGPCSYKTTNPKVNTASRASRRRRANKVIMKENPA